MSPAFVGREDELAVLTGGCVELSAAALPYAPFVAALRELVRDRGAAVVAGLLPGPGAGELAALLPRFGPPPPAPACSARSCLPRPSGWPASCTGCCPATERGPGCSR